MCVCHLSEEEEGSTSSCRSSSSSFLGLSRAPCSKGPGLGDMSGWNSTSSTVDEVRAAGRKLRNVSCTAWAQRDQTGKSQHIAGLELHTLFNMMCLNFVSTKERPERVVQVKFMVARYRLQVNTEGKGSLGKGG